MGIKAYHYIPAIRREWDRQYKYKPSEIEWQSVRVLLFIMAKLIAWRFIPLAWAFIYPRTLCFFCVKEITPKQNPAMVLLFNRTVIAHERCAILRDCVRLVCSCGHESTTIPMQPPIVRRIAKEKPHHPNRYYRWMQTQYGFIIGAFFAQK